MNDSYDIIVCGAGPAGMGAALAAGRLGAKTLLIEKDGAPGGVSTTGLMSHWTGTADSPLYREILARSCRAEARQFDELAHHINPEYLKITYIKLLREANVTPLFYAFVSDVIQEADRLVGVVATGKSGSQRYYAETVIDCTGDGDVAYRAGVPFVLGRESDHKMQPMTLMFKVGGVDTQKAVFPGSFESEIDTDRGELQALGKKLLPKPAGHVLLYRSTLPGVVTVNMTNAIGFDGTRAEELTKAEIECRLQIEPIIAFLREYAPGYKDCYLLDSASVIGVRETRHFKGLYTLSGEDVQDCVRFDDWVVRGAQFNFDIHNIEGAGLDENGVQKHFVQKAGGYYIPFRSLIPQNIGGLLLAGRCISGTHLAHSNYRAMPICLAMGEAAGTAAAIAARRKIPPATVNPKEIQSTIFK